MRVSKIKLFIAIGVFQPVAGLDFPYYLNGERKNQKTQYQRNSLLPI